MSILNQKSQNGTKNGKLNNDENDYLFLKSAENIDIPYHRQLLRDTPEYMIVRVPGFSQLLHIMCSLILLTPFQSFR